MPYSKPRTLNCRWQRSLVPLWAYLPGPKGVHFNTFPVTRHPSSDITDASSTFAVNQFLLRAAHGGICTVPRQVSSSFCFPGLPILTRVPELLPIFLLPIGSRRPGDLSIRTKVILPWKTQSRQLLSFFRPRPNYFTSMVRHSKVAQRCRQVDHYSICWKSLKSGFGSMLVGKPLHPMDVIYPYFCLQRRYSCYKCAGRLSNF
jgi:hypothetical protein